MPHYRDTETGRFVAESTYNRSVAHGGERYEVVEFPKAAPAEFPPDEVPPEFYEFEDYYFGGEFADEEAEY